MTIKTPFNSDGRWEAIRAEFLQRVEELDKLLGFMKVDPEWVKQMKYAYKTVESRKTDLQSDSLGCLLATALLNGCVLKGKLTDQECVDLTEEIIETLESLSKG